MDIINKKRSNDGLIAAKFNKFKYSLVDDKNNLIKNCVGVTVPFQPGNKKYSINTN